jgi:predicted Zn finger-like uncharacterized protein
MILQCPNCDTRYELPVDLPPEGRKVRCAACQHVWTATAAPEPSPEISLEDFEDEEIVFKEEQAGPAGEFVPEPDPAPETDAVPAGGGDLSESEMEDAFSAAMDGAGDAGFGEDEDLAAEPESPPIVIGRAKRRGVSMAANVAAGWAALGLVLAGAVGIAYFQRVGVVRLLPGAAAAYERIGLPVNVRGLAFEKVQYSWETSAGHPVLEVYGDIVNITSRPLKVPTVVFGLRTSEKVEVYQWAADVRAELLPAGQRTAFSAQIPTPPKSIRDVQIRFAKVR